MKQKNKYQPNKEILQKWKKSTEKEMSPFVLKSMQLITKKLSASILNFAFSS